MNQHRDEAKWDIAISLPISVENTTSRPTNNLPGIKGKVQQDEPRQHEDPVAANDDLEGHGGDVHNEWNKV